ncbi:MAG TPA: prolyl oligopeptidase family serine peptidase [Caldimonas sp.]|jgi:prolyl oligopeptidase
MKPVPPAIGLLIALAASLCAAASLPVAETRPVTDTYFGKTITDPYRYMEDLALPEVQRWARAQNDATRALLDAIPARAKLLARIEELEGSVQARISAVHRLPGELYFYEKRGANDNQFKLFMRRGLKGQEVLLVDPEALTQATGSPHAINFYAQSDSGRYVAYGMSEGGSEEASIHVLEVATKKEIIEPIDRAHYSHAAWLPDDSGFFYFRQRELPKGTPAAEKYRFQTAYLHLLKDVSPDRPILESGKPGRIETTPEEFPNVFPILGTPFVGAIPGNGVQREFSLYVAPLADATKPAIRWRKLVDAKDDVTDFAIHGDDLYLLSHQDALRFKVLRTSVAKPDLVHAEVVVAASREVIVGITAAKDALYVQARDGTVGKLYRLQYGGGSKAQPVALPREGSLEIASSDPRLPGLLISMGSWTRDFGYYLLDSRSRRFTDTGLQPLGPFGAPAGLATKEVTVKSWDGVEVPLSIVYPKDAKLDGGNPVLLYGYGSYGITDDPVYIPRFLAWYELGGVRATCHVRGGGAYGEEWHLAGKLATKPNTWKDFIACGEYLIKEGWTTKAKLAIHGGSAGGILVGRAMTERPDLFAVAVPEVGVLNALRGETSANGVPNIPEFGTVKDEKQFAALQEMDALDHVRDGVAYPATLLVHGINDPRVPVWESFKMAARLQAATSSGKPVLLRLDYAGGHGIGSTKSQRQEQYADIWTFMLWQFGDQRFQPSPK